MATPTALVTPRDIDILQALERSPLTARQLLALSETFSYPFTTERKVRARMQKLAESGRVRRWPYAIAGRGQPCYYTLTRQGFALLYGSEAPRPASGHFRRSASPASSTLSPSPSSSSTRRLQPTGLGSSSRTSRGRIASAFLPARTKSSLTALSPYRCQTASTSASSSS